MSDQKPPPPADAERQVYIIRDLPGGRAKAEPIDIPRDNTGKR